MVESAVTVGEGAGHQLGDDRAQWYDNARFARSRGDDAKIFVVQRDSEARLECSIEHVLLLLVQHLRAGQAAAEHLESGRGVHAVRLEEDDRLGERLDVRGDDELVRRLDGLARSAGADVDDGLAHHVEVGLGRLEVVRVAADHDRQRRVDRAGLAARHGRVDETQAPGRGLLGESRW